MTTIILKGKPKSTGTIYKMTCKGRFACLYMSEAGKTLKRDYIKQAKEQWKQKPIKGDVQLHILVYLGDKRNIDIDNIHKLTLDSLNKVVWEDDKQINKMTVEKLLDTHNPRVEITIL